SSMHPRHHSPDIVPAPSQTRAFAVAPWRAPVPLGVLGKTRRASVSSRFTAVSPGDRSLPSNRRAAHLIRRPAHGPGTPRPSRSGTPWPALAAWVLAATLARPAVAGP